MLLLQTLTESAFNKFEALTELNFTEVINILSTSLFVFLPLGTTKSNLSEKVLWSQQGLVQNIFLVFNKSVVCLSCMGISWISRWYLEWTLDERLPQYGHGIFSMVLWTSKTICLFLRLQRMHSKFGSNSFIISLCIIHHPELLYYFKIIKSTKYGKNRKG